MWCYTLPLKVMLRKIFFTIILFTAEKPSWQEKITYLIKLILTFGPIAFALESFDFWYQDNTQFFSFVIMALTLNMIVGALFHHKVGSFDWVQFFKKNGKMWMVLIITYALLEMLRLTAGNNLVGEGFKVLIQITTLLYPISKALKNIYIWSEKQFPPQFIMDKIYKFEKDGNLDDLFNKKDKKNEKN